MFYNQYTVNVLIDIKLIVDNLIASNRLSTWDRGLHYSTVGINDKQFF